MFSTGDFIRLDNSFRSRRDDRSLAMVRERVGRGMGHVRSFSASMIQAAFLSPLNPFSRTH